MPDFKPGDKVYVPAVTGHSCARCGKQLRDRLCPGLAYSDARNAAWTYIHGRWYCRYCRYAMKVTIEDGRGVRKLFEVGA